MRRFALAAALLACALLGMAAASMTIAGCGPQSGIKEQPSQAPGVSSSPSSTPTPTPTATMASVAAVWASGYEGTYDGSSGSRGALFNTMDGGDTWVATPEREVWYAANFVGGIAFSNPDTGWVVALDGDSRILATVDGGATWVQQAKDGDSGDSEVDFDLGTSDGVMTCRPSGGGIAASGEGRVWLTAAVDETDGPALLASRDGGKHWRVQVLPMSQVLGVAFADAQNGWAVGRGTDDRQTIVATNDGGAHWRAQYVGCEGDLNDAAFADSSNGWAVGDEGAILATSDGGAHWQRQHKLGDVVLSGVAVTDELNAWAVGFDAAKGVDVILATSDGGATWTNQEPGTTSTGFGSLEDVAFADAATGWVVGQSGMLVTTDGGLTWDWQPPSGSFATSEVYITRDSGDTFEKSVDENGDYADGISSSDVQISHICIARELNAE